MDRLRVPLRVRLKSLPQRFCVVLVCLALTAAYVALAGREFWAAHAARHKTLAGFAEASRLEPSNAEYHNQLGRWYEASSQFSEARQQYQAALRLNPHVARYWLDQADFYERMSDGASQGRALEEAIQVDPRTPAVAWRAGSFYLMQGQTDRALQQFRKVLESDSDLGPSVLDIAWRATHDVDRLLAVMLPADPARHLALIETLASYRETGAAEKVWSHLIQLRKPFELRRGFLYINYLIEQKEIPQAWTAWQEMAALNHLTAYLPSQNLIDNGGFDAEIVNAGFDWQYYRQPGVQLSLDETIFHGGHRALAIAFQGPEIDEVKMFHLVPIAPNSTYEFSGYFRTSDMEGAGGPRIAILDAYSGQTYYTTDTLAHGDVWREVNGTFNTGSGAKLAVLKILRVPEGRPIRGSLWLDDLELTRK
jgi:tetratricopeptide (TPR) repeat protein